MLKKIIVFTIILSMLSVMVACSKDNKEESRELTYEEQVEQFGKKITGLMNGKEYVKIAEYWSEAYVSLLENELDKSFSELKSMYKVNCINKNIRNAKVESVEIVETLDKDKIYCITISCYYDQNNDKTYAEDKLYVFMEGDKMVFIDRTLEIEDVIKVSKEKYQFASPITE